jgi:hypothetical protein
MQKSWLKMAGGTYGFLRASGMQFAHALAAQTRA